MRGRAEPCGLPLGYPPAVEDSAATERLVGEATEAMDEIACRVREESRLEVEAHPCLLAPGLGIDTPDFPC